MLEHPGRAELETEPAHLVVEVGDAARLNGELGLQGRPAGVADDRETPYQHAVFFTCALRQLVGPAVMVEGAGRHDLDLVAPGRTARVPPPAISASEPPSTPGPKRGGTNASFIWDQAAPGGATRRQRSGHPRAAGRVSYPTS